MNKNERKRCMENNLPKEDSSLLFSEQSLIPAINDPSEYKSVAKNSNNLSNLKSLEIEKFSLNS